MYVSVFSVRPMTGKLLYQFTCKGTLEQVWKKVERFSIDNPTLVVVTKVLA